MTLSKAVALRVTQLLIKNNMSQYRLLKITGIPMSTWQNIAKEKQSDIKLSTVSILASAFNLTLKQFFDDKLFDTLELGD